ncbi:QacE family quaternary ammonium compound efflux SMR transporter [Paenibacillus sp. MY03]|jgi:paired small multidrug resistance pump|uniref:QacE family quaternary ammonium compound efflux SMR transporter n=1 Tax=Paenibacillus agaridevorans TaxID=171404 RepID=A0A2R5EX25_9BACL|nr:MULTISPECIES: multidrug efflux SMR transporter [Paenibacillus]OUS75302.1 QacE family quaternary ammonium compound efflux SMR transporter [Paenibacillus sp. MY03]GBG07924.1 QacE family quaternary ammonium compound efflux SMR transporter [Paenibacillus agaridevorans]
MSSSNNKYWFIVVIAACFEVIWVIGLKHADSVWEWIVTGVAIVVSFGLLIYSSRILPTSTVYAVFVGLGTAGSVIAEMTVFGVPFNWGKIAFISLLLTGVIGLKLVTHEREGGTSS